MTADEASEKAIRETINDMKVIGAVCFVLGLIAGFILSAILS